MLFILPRDVLSMETIESNHFKVHFSGESRNIAEELLVTAEKSYRIFKRMMDTHQDFRIEIYWANRNDWSTIPQCRYKQSYGMPHMTRGGDHTHYVILPAANIDMPDRLTEIMDPMIDTAYLDERDTSILANHLLGNSYPDRNDLRKYLSSSRFYIDYLINIVSIHEIMHNFCFESGLGENYGRDGRKAWWVFEGMAQWSVLMVQRELGNRKWADIHELLYRWIYRSGHKKEGNESLVEYGNYAWFHGSLVEMFSQLEEKYGGDFGHRVFESLLHNLQGRDYLSDRDAVRVFSKAAGEDLSGFFGKRWGIRPE